MAEEGGNPQAAAGSGGQTNSGQSEIGKDARTWVMLCHLAVVAGYICALGNIILPLIFWQIKKTEYPFVDEHGKEALNFQISMTIYALLTMPLCFICIGLSLLSAVVIVDIVLLIIAAIKANNGEFYRYPLTIRLVK